MQITKSKNSITAFTFAELLLILAVIFIMGALFLPAMTGGHGKCKSVRINCASQS